MTDKEINPDQAFLDGIKIALLRHCLMNKTEEEFMRKIINNILDILRNPTDSNMKLQYLDIIENIKTVINTKTDRLVSFHNLMKSTGHQLNTYDEITNLQTRSEKLYKEMISFDIVPKSIESKKDMLNEFKKDDFLGEGFKLLKELDEFNDEIIEITGNQINTICTTSHNSVVGLKEVLLDNHCSEIKK